MRNLVAPYFYQQFGTLIHFIVLSFDALHHGFKLHFPMINFCVFIGRLGSLFY